MTGWLTRARDVFQKTPCTPTDKTGETPLLPVSPVPPPPLSKKTVEGFAGFAGMPPTPFLENEGAPTCATCRHRTVYGNCREPVAAGLTSTFMLVRHPDGGAGCPAHELPPAPESPLESRLAQLVAIGAIDQAEADLCLARYAVCPDEWDLLLDWCEAAVSDRCASHTGTGGEPVREAHHKGAPP